MKWRMCKIFEELWMFDELKYNFINSIIKKFDRESIANFNS